MPLEDLETLASLNIPDSGCLIRAARQETVSLGIEGDLQRDHNRLMFGLTVDSHWQSKSWAPFFSLSWDLFLEQFPPEGENIGTNI